MRETKACTPSLPRPHATHATVALALLGLLLSSPALPASEPTASPTPGIAWVRFNSSRFSRPLDTGVADRIDVDTGTTFNDYSQIWLGLIEFPTDQPVTFTAEADDGLRLIVDGATVIDGWGSDRPRRGTFRARAGERVPLRVEYFQSGGVGHLRLYWQWEGCDRELVPASAFFHTDKQTVS